MTEYRPRAYVDWEVPRDAEGTEIGVCTNDAEVSAYVEWLAAYLYETEIEVPESQRPMLEEFGRLRGASSAALFLAEYLGHSGSWIEALELKSGTGVPFSEHHAEERETWDELSESRKEWWTEARFFTPEEVYRSLGQEYKASKTVPSHIRHADIPFRAVLAALLKPVSEREKRVEVLASFFFFYNEAAMK